MIQESIIDHAAWVGSADSDPSRPADRFGLAETNSRSWTYQLDRLGGYDGETVTRGETDTVHSDPQRLVEFWALARRIAQLGTQGGARLEFLRDLSRLLLPFSRADAVELWMSDTDLDYYWRMSASAGAEPRFRPLNVRASGDRIGAGPRLSELLPAIWTMLLGSKAPCGTAAAPVRSMRIDAPGAWRRAFEFAAASNDWIDPDRPETPGPMLLHLLGDAGEARGLLMLSGSAIRDVTDGDLFLFEQVMETLGRAIANRRAQFRLKERIKELTCLHGVAQAAGASEGSLDDVMNAILARLRDAMQFPELVVVRLNLDEQVRATADFPGGDHCLSIPIRIGGTKRGVLEVCYRTSHAEFAAGAFLHEEEDLLKSVAHEIAALMERTEAAAAQASLAEQLRHADRLATIGQLAAGVAHELNEPLGNILGFAQLLQKQTDLTGATRDAEKIVHAVLHAREIVKKLLLFARQSEARRSVLDLGNLVRESLYFLEARCRRSGIDLRLDLTDEPTPIVAVPSEMTQVLVNLAVNAMQAMPNGGALSIQTRRRPGIIILSVADTGTGMTDEIRRRLFTPFFTTKDVGQGTGLGLSVVHGIVSAHGGTIGVESAPDEGTRFEVKLPLADSADLAERGGP